MIAAGLLWPLLQKIGLGRLPGDIVIERENFRIERLLQIDVQRTGAEAATVHRAQHLNIADRIEAVAGRDPLADDLQDLAAPSSASMHSTN